MERIRGKIKTGSGRFAVYALKMVHQLVLPGGIAETQLTLEIDLNSLLRSFTNEDQNMEKAQAYFEAHRFYEIDEEHTFYLSLLSFDIDTQTNTLTRFRVEGYLLEK